MEAAGWVLLLQVELVSELARGVEPPWGYSLEDRSLGVHAVRVGEKKLQELWNLPLICYSVWPRWYVIGQAWANQRRVVYCALSVPAGSCAPVLHSSGELW